MSSSSQRRLEEDSIVTAWVVGEQDGTEQLYLVDVDGEVVCSLKLSVCAISVIRLIWKVNEPGHSTSLAQLYECLAHFVSYFSKLHFQFSYGRAEKIAACMQLSS